MNNVLLRKVQLAQLEIAKEFKRICDENNINYFMDSGTLLGAVRHKGFIPWDDDMDFGMLREEYERFIDIAPSQLNEKYFLQTWDTDNNYPFAFAKIRKKGTVYLESSFEQSKAHNELYIDIFPYDVFPDDEKKRNFQIKKIRTYKNILLMMNNVYPWFRHKSFVKRMLVRLKYCPYFIYSLFTTRDKIIEKYKKLVIKYNNEISKYYVEQSGGTLFGNWIIPQECFNGYANLMFEDTELMAPINPDLYLKTSYGDYMKLPPENKRENRHGIIKLDLGKL